MFRSMLSRDDNKLATISSPQHTQNLCIIPHGSTEPELFDTIMSNIIIASCNPLTITIVVELLLNGEPVTLYLVFCNKNNE